MKQHLHFALAVLFLVFGISVACITGHVQLANRILEICNNSVWKTVCSENWGNLDAAVACKQLGFAGGYTVKTVSFSRSLLNPIAYHCNGRETSLQNCGYESNNECNRGVNITCVHRNTSDSCRRGDIRLWGGSSQYEGNIELCTDQGIWSTISDVTWEIEDAVVACRQLGYANFIAVPFHRSKFGERLQVMEYGGIECRGNETSLLHCRVFDPYVEILSNFIISNQRDYAGVRCILRSARPQCNNGAVRFTDGYSNNNGFAEVCIEGEWIGICKSDMYGYRIDYDTSMALLMCNQLGYQRFTNIDESFFTSNRSEPLAYVYPARYGCNSRSQTPVLDCIFRSRYYGFAEYTDRCTNQGVLCCPNDITQCSFSGPQNSPMSPGNPRLQPSKPSTASEMATATSNFRIGTTTFSLNPTFPPELHDQGSPSSMNSGILIGGVIGGIIVITILSIIIVTMLVSLSHRKGVGDKNEVVYEEPDLHLYKEKKLKNIELEHCPAYGENINRANQNVEMKECPAYAHI